MLIKKIDKRAELTSTQLITIIILIISFAIIVAFFFMLGLKSTIDKESCRNSVMMRGIVPVFKGIVTLKCKTQDICFSMGGKCETQSKDLVTTDVKNTDELIKEMDNLIKECWWMMGDGKVDYGKNSCAICHKVYFDNKLKKSKSITFNGNEINLAEEYVVITGASSGTHFPAIFVKFSADELKKLGCSEYVTEI